MRRPNRSDYNLNRNAVPAEESICESRQHGGQLVARSTDGLETYAYGDSYEELFQLLSERRIDPQEAVIARVPNADEGAIF